MGLKHRFQSLDTQGAHFTSWLLKDIFWCLKFTWAATFMILPTLFLTFYILIKDKYNRQTNLILTSWVLMNVFWMLHELHNITIQPVYFFMFFGTVVVTKSLLK
jgi:hypothetical protein